MLARRIKNIFRAYIVDYLQPSKPKANQEIILIDFIIDFLNIIFGKGEQTSIFWDKVLIPSVNDYYQAIIEKNKIIPPLLLHSVLEALNLKLQEGYEDKGREGIKEQGKEMNFTINLEKSWEEGRVIGEDEKTNKEKGEICQGKDEEGAKEEERRMEERMNGRLFKTTLPFKRQDFHSFRVKMKTYRFSGLEVEKMLNNQMIDHQSRESFEKYLRIKETKESLLHGEDRALLLSSLLDIKIKLIDILLIKNDLEQALFEIDEALQLFGMKNSPTGSPLPPQVSLNLPSSYFSPPRQSSSSSSFDCFSPLLIKIYLPLVKLSLAQDNLNKSKIFLKRVESLFSSLFSGYHPLLLSFYSLFYIFFKRKGLYARSLKYLSKNVFLASKCLGSNHPEVGRNLVEQGRLELKIGDQAKGIEKIISGFNILQVGTREDGDREKTKTENDQKRKIFFSSFSLSKKEEVAELGLEIAEGLLNIRNYFVYFFCCE